mgnify:CR=1
MDRLSRKKNFTKAEKDKITREMVEGYQKMAAVDEDLIKNASIIKDGTK